jgi:hypothetical protein
MLQKSSLFVIVRKVWISELLLIIIHFTCRVVPTEFFIQKPISFSHPNHEFIQSRPSLRTLV